MTEHHCRVVQTRPGDGEVVIATGTKLDGDDVIHLSLVLGRDLDMPQSQLEAHIASIQENTDFATVLIWDD